MLTLSNKIRVLKRKNRDLFKVDRALMFTTNIPKNQEIKGDAYVTFLYFTNQMYNYILPFETLLQKLQHFFTTSHPKSNLTLKVFDCTIFVQEHKKRCKIYPKDINRVFIGIILFKKTSNAMAFYHQDLCQSQYYII